MEAKQKELQERYKNGEIKNVKKKDVLKKLDELNAYPSPNHYPKELIPGKLYVDNENMAILVPVSKDQMVPFHASIIKNISTNQEGQYTSLRINFHVPSGSNNMSQGLQFPKDLGNQPIII